MSLIFSDWKQVVGSSSYSTEILATNNYYPFGMLMPGYTNAKIGGTYRYGYNDMEKDDDIKGVGNSYDFGARMYDSRLGRFLSLDPLACKFAGWSPYAYAMNRPIDGMDLDGLEWVSKGITYNVLEGRFEAQITITLAVVNKSKIIERSAYSKNKELLEKMVDIKRLTEFNMQTGTGSLTDPYLNVEINFVEDSKSKFTITIEDVKSDKDGMHTAGEVTSINNTQKNNTDLAISVDGKLLYQEDDEGEGIAEMSRTLAHELLHTAGIRHLWDKQNKIKDAQNVPFPLASNRGNLINSHGNPKPALRPPIPLSVQVETTRGQRNAVLKNVTEQQKKSTKKETTKKKSSPKKKETSKPKAKGNENG